MGHGTTLQIVVLIQIKVHYGRVIIKRGSYPATVYFYLGCVGLGKGMQCTLQSALLSYWVLLFFMQLLCALQLGF